MLFLKKIATKELKVFFVYTILLSIFVSVTLLSLFLKSSTLYQVTVKVYVVSEYIIFAYFLYLIFLSKRAKNLIIYSIIPFLLFALYDYFKFPDVFSQNVLIVEFLFFIVFLIYFFYEKMQTIVLYPVYQRITFWLCVAFFLYFTGNFFCLTFSKSSTDPAFRDQLKLVYSFVTISKNIVLCLALFGNEPAEEKEEQFNIPNDINLDEFTLTQFKNT